MRGLKRICMDEKVDLRKLIFVNRDNYILELCKGKKVLHLGCTDFPYTKEQYANGRLLHARLTEVAGYVVGVDISKEGIQWIERRFKAPCHHGDIEQSVFMSRFEKGSFDIVLLTDVLEHINNPGSALDNVSKICRNGSKLIVTVPNAHSLKSFLRVVIGFEHIHPDHVSFHSPYTMTNLLRRYGFRVEGYFSFLGGGTGLVAMITNIFLRFCPRLSEGIGFIAVSDAME